METIADEQQWEFQESKHNRSPRLEKHAADYERGFLTSGLFSISRHPNFFAEQMLWVSFYLFAVVSSASLAWPVVLGVTFLIMLFQGSTDLTEKLSLQKYPAYAQYQLNTWRLWPGLPKNVRVE
jgi:steroid 5-alpha reductase family enzyme